MRRGHSSKLKAMRRTHARQRRNRYARLRGHYIVSCKQKTLKYLQLTI